MRKDAQHDIGEVDAAGDRLKGKGRDGASQAGQGQKDTIVKLKCKLIGV